MDQTPAAVLPLPTEPFDDGVIVASCWGNDCLDDGPLFAHVLILRDTPGSHYVVEEIIWMAQNRTPEWSPTVRTAYPNIIPATAGYSESTGMTLDDFAYPVD